MNAPCPTPNRCRFTGCPGDCQPPREAAAIPSFGQTSAAVALTRLALIRRIDAPVKSRDVHSHRKLLVAALS